MKVIFRDEEEQDEALTCVKHHILRCAGDLWTSNAGTPASLAAPKELQDATSPYIAIFNGHKEAND